MPSILSKKLAALLALAGLGFQAVTADFILANFIASYNGETTSEQPDVCQYLAVSTNDFNCNTMYNNYCNGGVCNVLKNINANYQCSLNGGKFSVYNFCSGNNLDFYPNGNGGYNGYMAGGDGSIVATCNSMTSWNTYCPGFEAAADITSQQYCSSYICGGQ